MMYHKLRDSEKKKVLEDLEIIGASKNNIYYWLKGEKSFEKMPGNMQDVVIANLPAAKPLFRRVEIPL